MNRNLLKSEILLHSMNDLSHAERRVHWLLDNYGMELAPELREALEGLEKHMYEVKSLICKSIKDGDVPASSRVYGFDGNGRPVEIHVEK